MFVSLENLVKHFIGVVVLCMVCKCIPKHYGFPMKMNEITSLNNFSNSRFS